MELYKIFNMFKQPAEKVTLDEEMGDAGTTIYNGFISGEEYNGDLTGLAKYTMYDKMRKGDASVATALKVVKLPLRSANWYVEPASDEDSDKEIAAFIEYNLMEEMSITWNDFLRQALLMLDYGVFVFEKVFGYVEFNGKQYIGWKKFAPRHPRTVTKWAIKETGDGITQQLVKGGEAHIPMEKLLVFVNEKEGDNWEGISLIRPAYKHWFFKDIFEQIDAMAFERQGLGVPYCQIPKGSDAKDKANAKTLVQNLRANEKAYAVYPTGFEVGFLDMKAKSTRDPKESIMHHQRSIVLSVLAQFLMLGASSGSGSRALSEDHSDMFFDSLQAVSKQIIDTINKYAIKQLVDLNFPGVKKYPKLQVDDIGSIDKKAFSEMMDKLISGEMISPSEELEKYIRKELDLPEKEEADEDDEETIRLELELDMLQIEIAGEGMETEPEEEYEEEVQEMVEEAIEDERLIFAAKGQPLSDETKKKISEALKKKYGDKIKEQENKINRSESAMADARRRIDELKSVVTKYKEKAKSIKDKNLKKQFNNSIKNKVEEIKKMIKSGKDGIKVEKQRVRESKKQIREERSQLKKEKKQRKIERQIDNDNERIAKLEKSLADKKDSDKADKIRERVEKIKERINDNTERLTELEMSEDEKKNLIFNFKPRRKLTYAEKKVNWENLNSQFEKAEKDLEKILKNSFSQQKDEILGKFKTAIKAKDYKTIQKISMAAPAEYNKELLEKMKELYNYGKNTAAAEMRTITPATPPKEMERLKASADIIVSDHENKIMTASKVQAMNDVSKGKSSSEAMKLLTATMVTKANELAEQTGSIIAGGMINDGRRLAQQGNSSKIYALQRSELLDNRTCNFCESFDGRVVKLSDPWAKEGTFHSNCRGIWVEIMMVEPEKPKITGIPKSIAERYNKPNDFKQLKSPIVNKDSLAADSIKEEYQKEIKKRESKIEKYKEAGQYENRIEAHKKEIERMKKVLANLK